MFNVARPEGYYARLNEALLAAVPESAEAVLEVGCGDGRLGAALKEARPTRRVWGVEEHPGAAARARAVLDGVFEGDVETTAVPLPEGSLDCLLYGDVLEHLRDPLAVLRRHRKLLSAGGRVLACVPNVQHHSLVVALLTGDFQYAGSGLLDAGHLRFFSWSTLYKLLLDAGLWPRLVGALEVPTPEVLWRVLEPAARALRLHPGRTRRALDAYQYVVEGLPSGGRDEDAAVGERGAVEPLTFVACVNDEEQARDNLLASPCLGAGSPHEVLLFRRCKSAAEGLNAGIEKARHARVVCLHQDVYLPAGWDRAFVASWDAAEALLGRLGVVGVYGVRTAAGRVERAGLVVDRERLLREPAALPAVVDTLDELLLGVRRDSGLRFEPELGFHFYGADACLRAQGRGLPAVAVEALCFHNSRSVELPPAFGASAAVFARKWAARLPVATSCVVVEPGGRLRVS